MPENETDILDSAGAVADQVAEIAGSGVAGRRARLAAVIYETAKKAGVMTAFTNLVRGIVNLVRGRG